MTTNCELCCAEIEDSEVNQCPVCQADGLCPDCLNDHQNENDEKCYGSVEANNA
jgi:hypothetical protein